MKHLKIITTILLVAFTTITFAQGFEGQIDFVRKNTFDATHYTYYVSHGHVKIDELNKDGKVMGTMIVDLKNKSAVSINHERKMYMDIKTKPSTKNMEMCMTFKKNEKKEILGFKCTKWVVKNDTYKTEGVYWVIDDANYFFFNELLNILNRKDKIALYFMQIHENAGFFPIMGKEVGYDGKVKAELVTKKITVKKFDDSFFKLPEGYKKFN